MEINLNCNTLHMGYLACSKPLIGTSNRVHSNWALYTFFQVYEGVPKVRYEIRKKMYYNEVLFFTEDYEELKEWVNNHLEELSNQVKEKEELWIKEHKK